ncbi:hypothetical protein LINPERHAP2_LOCUS37700, partial [Linum perenne]
ASCDAAISATSAGRWLIAHRPTPEFPSQQHCSSSTDLELSC